jgi:hypothetical protein
MASQTQTVEHHEDRVRTPDLIEAVTRAAQQGERVVFERAGGAYVAVIPVEDLDFLEALEDAQDARAARDALAEDQGARIPWEDVKADLGL